MEERAESGMAPENLDGTGTRRRRSAGEDAELGF